MFMFFLFVYCGVLQVSGEIQNVPIWPPAYTVQGRIRVPYAEINEPFQAWYDNSLGSSRVDYYNGLVKTYQLSNVGKYGTYFKMEPVLTSMKCFKTEGTVGKKVRPQSVLPDMTGYQYKGEVDLNGIKAEKWERASFSDIVFTMYLYWKKEASTKVIIPLRYEQLGSDHHYMDFEKYTPRHPSPGTFQVPNASLCKPLQEYEFDGLEDQLVYSFNPISEYVDNVTEHVDIAWNTYKNQFNKKYDQDEENQRKNIFRQRMRYITSTNRANLSYTAGVNHMTDYTTDELQSLTSCLFDTGSFGRSELIEEADNETAGIEVSLPGRWDWRNRGAVTPVKDQSDCGSCWSFSATGAIEGAYFLKSKKRVTLSEQVLVDCSWNYGNKGCDGGYMDGAFKWVMKNGGIPLSGAYGPYMARQNFCHFKRGMKGVRIRTYRRAKKNNPNSIKSALIKYGPIAVGMHATNNFVTAYRGGVYNDRSCNNKKMNHAVLIVGYGVMGGQEYWLIKNSWGNRWGIGGYALMAIKGNICGIMQDPIYVQA